MALMISDFDLGNRKSTDPNGGLFPSHDDQVPPCDWCPAPQAQPLGDLLAVRALVIFGADLQIFVPCRFSVADSNDDVGEALDTLKLINRNEVLQINFYLFVEKLIREQ